MVQAPPHRDPVVPERLMEMQPDSLKEVLSELFALLETQETNSAAVLQLLKDQCIASDEKTSERSLRKF